MQIPQATTTILQNRGIKLSIINNDGEYHDTAIYLFYDRNPAGRGLEVDEFPAQKADFLRYAVQFNCINPITDIIKCPLPPLEEISLGVSIQIQAVIIKGTRSRRDIDAALCLAEAEDEWFPAGKPECAHTLELNLHIGAEGAMSPGRVQDMEEAKTVVINFNKTTGAVAIVIKRKFLITCLYTEAETGRLLLDLRVLIDSLMYRFA